MKLTFVIKQSRTTLRSVAKQWFSNLLARIVKQFSALRTRFSVRRRLILLLWRISHRKSKAKEENDTFDDSSLETFILQNFDP